MHRRNKWLLAGAVAAMMFSACSTGPIPGRRHINLVPDAQMMAVSFQQYGSFLDESTLSTNRGLTRPFYSTMPCRLPTD